MAVSPPGDIILEVARAAEPAAIRSARARLEGAADPAPANARAAAGAGSPRATVSRASRHAPETYQKFEAMVLQSFIKPMLPSDADAVYGGGTAGEMWKSLLARQMGDVLAARGGIGIADRLAGEQYTTKDGTKVPVRGISGGPDKDEADRQALLSAALVDEIERRTAHAIGLDRTQKAAGRRRDA